MHTLLPHSPFASPPVEASRQQLVLGLPFSPITAKGALDRCVEFVESRQPHHIVTANVDFLARSESDAEARNLIFEADEVFCDGMPLVWASRWFGQGNSLPERVTGSDLVPALLKRCAAEGHSVFFLGSDEGTMSRLKTKLDEELPDLEIAGALSPPVGPIESWDNELIVKTIRTARPDVLLVAVGFPKQDRWIRQYRERVQVPLMVGVGASLDFIAGKQIRAPRWMQRTGLEWLWRMGTDPGRLVRRYGNDARMLAGALVRQLRFSILHRLPVWRGRKVDCQGMLNGARLDDQCEILRWDPTTGLVSEGKDGAAVCVFDLSGVEKPDRELLESVVDAGRRAMREGERFALFGAGRRMWAWLKAFGISEGLWPVFDSPRALTAWATGTPLPGRSLESPIRARHFDRAAREVEAGFRLTPETGTPIRIDLGGEDRLARSSAHRLSGFLKTMESLERPVSFVNLDDKGRDALEIFDLTEPAAA